MNSSALEESKLEDTPLQEWRKAKAEELGPLDLKSIIPDEFLLVSRIHNLKEKVAVVSKFNEKLEQGLKDGR